MRVRVRQTCAPPYPPSLLCLCTTSQVGDGAEPALALLFGLVAAAAAHSAAGLPRKGGSCRDFPLRLKPEHREQLLRGKGTRFHTKIST